MYDQKYIGRPLDNSIGTQKSFDLEAQHWKDAFENAEIGKKTMTMKEVGELLGQIFTIISGLTMVTSMGIRWIYRTFFKRIKSKKELFDEKMERDYGILPEKQRIEQNKILQEGFNNNYGGNYDDLINELKT